MEIWLQKLLGRNYICVYMFLTILFFWGGEGGDDKPLIASSIFPGFVTPFLP